MNVYLVSCSVWLDLRNALQVGYRRRYQLRTSYSVRDGWMSEYGASVDWGNRSTRRKICASPTLSVKTLTRTNLGSYRGHCDARPAVDRLSHGTVQVRTSLLHVQEWIHIFCLLMQSNCYRQGSPCVCHKRKSGDWRYSSIVSWFRNETKESGWPASRPIRPPSPLTGRNRPYPLNRSLGGPQDPSGHCQENSFSCRAPNPRLFSQKPPLLHLNLFSVR